MTRLHQIRQRLCHSRSVGTQIIRLQQSVDMLKSMESKSESAEDKIKCEEAIASQEVVSNRLRDERDAEKTESQLTMAALSRLQKAQGQLAKPTRGADA
eukprot:9155274-Pyramimonas_sp.AAC.1